MINIIMPDNVKSAIEILKKNEYEAYIVGGCVRDSVLGYKPSDWDITTSATPEEILRCFDKYKTISTGLKHGTVTVIINNMQIEITTYRIDGEYKDNRRPELVNFTKDISFDLERRDFTINAIAYNNDGIIDLFGGLNDIDSRIIKCVGNPDKRFNEDGLRILRALRFASVLGFDIDKNTSDSIHKNKELLKNISEERITSEFNKLIKGINYYIIMNEYKGIIAEFIPELNYLDNKLWINMLKSMSLVDNDLILKLVILCIGISAACEHDYAETSYRFAEKILKRLKYDNSTIEQVKNLVLYHNTEIVPINNIIKKLMNKLGSERFKQLLVVKRAYIKSSGNNVEALNNIDRAKSIVDEILEQKQCFSLKDLAVNGRDLIESGIPQGVYLGEILKILLEKVIDEELENKKSILINYAKNNIIVDK